MVTQACEELQHTKDYTLLLQWRLNTVEEARETHDLETKRLPHPLCSWFAPLSDICGTITNPFILWDRPNALVHASQLVVVRLS